MPYSLTSSIGWTAMQGMLTVPTGGVATIDPIERILKQTKPLEGLTAEWIRVSNSRQNAPFNDHGGESRAMSQEGFEEVSIKCMHVLNHINHKQELLASLRDFNNADRQARAVQLIEYETGEFKRKHENQKVSAAVSCLVNNAIYLDANGNLLPSSSGAKRTVNFGATYTGSGALAYNTDLGGSATIGDWATSSTDITEGIANLKRWYRKVNGRELKYAIHGRSVAGYLKNNDHSEIWQTIPSIGEKFAAGQVPMGYFAEGLVWIAGDQLGFADTAGDYQYSLAADQVLFLPEIDRSWIEVMNGSEEVPTGEDTFDDVDASLARGLRTATGAYTCCHINRVPPAKLTQYMGDNYMIALKEATAPVLADVKNG